MNRNTAFALGDEFEKARQWGLYHRSDGLSVARLRKSDPVGEVSDIDPDEAGHYDACLCILRRENRTAYDVVFKHYRDGEPLLALGYEFNLPLVEVEKALSFGVGYALAMYRSGLARQMNKLEIETKEVKKPTKADETAKRIRAEIIRLRQRGEVVNKTVVAELVGISRQQLTRKYNDLFKVAP
ncbi:MAG: hypothetical protein OXE99_04835 [Cellvibrionales bacterium]|nr:hypothetical protein [Cellvibrionales bacterium]